MNGSNGAKNLSNLLAVEQPDHCRAHGIADIHVGLSVAAVVATGVATL